ncbi:hypothetical protein ACFE04_005623 [Oxalis oulophora]
MEIGLRSERVSPSLGLPTTYLDPPAAPKTPIECVQAKSPSKKVSIVNVFIEDEEELPGPNKTSTGCHSTFPSGTSIRLPNSRGITLAPTPRVLPPRLLMYIDDLATFSMNIPCEEKLVHNKAHLVLIKDCPLVCALSMSG